MSLLSVTELRAVVPSPLEDADLQLIIDRVEAEITDVIGFPFVDASTTITEDVQVDGRNLFVKRPILSVDSVTDSNGNAIALTGFDVWENQGRLERLHSHHNSLFGRPSRKFTVVYVPQDQRLQRKQAVIDLVRIVLSQTALTGETVAGEYSYTAPPNWYEEKRRVMRNLVFNVV